MKSIIVLMLPCILFAQADPAEVLADKAIAHLKLEEKLSILAGNSTMTVNALSSLDMQEEFRMSDGPHTVRPELARDSFASAKRSNDHSTCLPSLSALAATWNRELAGRFGHVLGEEARARGKDMLLGPGVNIQRVPLNGRNWEYLSEDPFLTSRLVVPLIKALQSHDVAACVKHFALNNQELNRTEVDVEVDERTLFEIYLPAFKAAVQEAGVLAVMNAYNKFRGVYCSENNYLLDDILRKRWGFKGLVVTDWGAMHDTMGAAIGGTDLEMDAGSSIKYFKKPLADAVASGKLDTRWIDEKARHILYVWAKIGKISGRVRDAGSLNTPEHKQTALDVAEESVVLLKNDEGKLPLDPAKLRRILIVGHLATNEHCYSGWSAEGKPLHETTFLEGITNRIPAATTYLSKWPANKQGAEKLKAIALNEAEEVILFTGTSHGHGRARECEGGDRPDLEAEDAERTGLAMMLAWRPDAIVVNHSGSAMEMPWFDYASSVLHTWYAGQESGTALARILFGDATPSGKMPQTFPRSLADTPAAAETNRYDAAKSIYSEGIFVGYRWYDKHDIVPLVPFGFGLSYTTFSYGQPVVERKQFGPLDEVKLSIPITNTGTRNGKEIVQLYVSARGGRIERPRRELKGFEKISLTPGETKEATFFLTAADLAYYDTRTKKFRCDPGEYNIEFAASSRDIRAEASIWLTGTWFE